MLAFQTTCSKKFTTSSVATALSIDIKFTTLHANLCLEQFKKVEMIEIEFSREALSGVESTLLSLSLLHILPTTPPIRVSTTDLSTNISIQSIIL